MRRLSLRGSQAGEGKEALRLSKVLQEDSRSLRLSGDGRAVTSTMGKGCVI